MSYLQNNIYFNNTANIGKEKISNSQNKVSPIWPAQLSNQSAFHAKNFKTQNKIGGNLESFKLEPIYQEAKGTYNDKINQNNDTSTILSQDKTKVPQQFREDLLSCDANPLKIAIVACSDNINGNAHYDDLCLKNTLNERGIIADIVDWRALTKNELWQCNGIVVNSAWNLHLHLDEFDAWLEACEEDGQKRLINDKDILRVGIRKDRYLLPLLGEFGTVDSKGGCIIPSVFIRDGNTSGRFRNKCFAEILEDLNAENASLWSGDVVIKPITSADGDNTYRLTKNEELLNKDNTKYQHFDHGNRLFNLILKNQNSNGVIIQPFMKAVEDSGEYQLVFIYGEFTHATVKPKGFKESAKELRRQVFEDQLPIGMLDFANSIMSFLMKQYAPNVITRTRIDLFAGEKGPILCEAELVEPNTNIQCLTEDKQKEVINKYADAIITRCKYFKTLIPPNRGSMYYSMEDTKAEDIEMMSNARLVPVQGIQVALVHSIMDDSIQEEHPFLADIVLEKLHEANTLLKKSFPDVELVVLDAYRTHKDQKKLASSYYQKLIKQCPQMSIEEFASIAGQFVMYEKNYNPYSAGGAIDVGLLKSGKPMPMPTFYGEFQSESDHSVSNKTLENAQLLLTIMSSAGFVNDGVHWWHYQYGTLFWASKRKQVALLRKNFASPFVQEDIVYSKKVSVPQRLPTLHKGVAPAFVSHRNRANVLNKTEDGHFYVRSKQPTVDQGLGTFLKTELNAKHITLVESGLSACLLSIKAIVPPNGTLVYDKFIYYECERGLLKEAKIYGWKLIKMDLLNVEDLLNLNEKVDAIYLDSPRNWFLDTLDITAIAKICRSFQAKLIVDTSVQPLQDVLSKGADVSVLSLSKYPSNGMTVGGALICNDEQLAVEINYTCKDQGHVLSPCAAMTVWENALSMHSRLVDVSNKAEEIAKLLSQKHTDIVKKVRIPKKEELNGLCGGQICFHVANKDQGLLMELLIAQNSLSQDAVIDLMGTFGGARTTFEHFGSNKRKRYGIRVEDTNECLIPDDIIRIGIGLEPLELLLKKLTFLLNTSSYLWELSNNPGMNRQLCSEEIQEEDSLEIKTSKGI